MREEDGATWTEKAFNRRGRGEKREDRQEDSEYGSASGAKPQLVCY
jgi:hypothetical protein